MIGDRELPPRDRAEEGGDVSAEQLRGRRIPREKGADYLRWLLIRNYGIDPEDDVRPIDLDQAGALSPKERIDAIMDGLDPDQLAPREPGGEG